MKYNCKMIFVCGLLATFHVMISGFQVLPGFIGWLGIGWYGKRIWDETGRKEFRTAGVLAVLYALVLLTDMLLKYYGKSSTGTELSAWCISCMLELGLFYQLLEGMGRMMPPEKKNDFFEYLYVRIVCFVVAAVTTYTAMALYNEAIHMLGAFVLVGVRLWFLFTLREFGKDYENSLEEETSV